MLIPNFLQINAKQSSVRNAAFEAARLVVEQQYKIEDGNGWKSNAQEIQALVARELDGEPLQWTVGTTYTNREASTAIISTSYNLLKDIPDLQWYLPASVHPGNHCQNLLHEDRPLRWVIPKILPYLQSNPIATHCLCSYIGMSPHPPHMQALLILYQRPPVLCRAILMEDRCLAEYSIFCQSISEGVQRLHPSTAAYEQN